MKELLVLLKIPLCERGRRVCECVRACVCVCACPRGGRRRGVLSFCSHEFLILIKTNNDSNHNEVLVL